MGTERAGPGIELRKGPKTESIRIVFSYRGVKCREPLKLAHTKKNIAYATRRRGEILNAIERGTFVYSEFFPESSTVKLFQPDEPATPPTPATVGELLREYLILAKRNLALSSFLCYQQVAEDHLFPQWDSTPLNELTTKALRSWIMTLKGKRKTIQLILTPLRNTLEQAVVDQLIANPFDSIRLKKILAREQLSSNFKADPFDIDEIEAILKACDREQERNMFLFAFCTGMRPSEYIALQWGSVNLAGHRISVERAFVDGAMKDTAKTEAGLRDIDIRQGAYAALQAQQRFTAESGELVFLNPSYSEQWAGDKPIYRRWRRILRTAEVRFRNPYQTRHTFASSLLMLGSVPLYVATQMGHTDTAMITRTYGKWIRSGLNQDKRRRLELIYRLTDPTH